MKCTRFFITILEELLWELSFQLYIVNSSRGGRGQTIKSQDVGNNQMIK